MLEHSEHPRRILTASDGSWWPLVPLGAAWCRLVSLGVTWCLSADKTKDRGWKSLRWRPLSEHRPFGPGEYAPHTQTPSGASFFETTVDFYGLSFYPRGSIRGLSRALSSLSFPWKPWSRSIITPIPNPCTLHRIGTVHYGWMDGWMDG